MEEKTKKRLIRLGIEVGILAVGIITGANLPDGIAQAICAAVGFC